jgi:hypothetical protein
LSNIFDYLILGGFSMTCKNCGAEGSGSFCAQCGSELVANEIPLTPTPILHEKQLPEQYKPLSPWAYFALQLLFSVPIVGFIFLIIFSCKKSNINRRNFARSYWCSLILAGIVAIIYIILITVYGVSVNTLY